MPALVVLWRDGRRIAVSAGFLLFALAPMWWTPHFGGPDEYGLHGLVTVVANCYLLAGLAFVTYMGARAFARTAAVDAGRHVGIPIRVLP